MGRPLRGVITPGAFTSWHSHKQEMNKQRAEQLYRQVSPVILVLDSFFLWFGFSYYVLALIANSPLAGCGFLSVLMVVTWLVFPLQRTTVGLDSCTNSKDRKITILIMKVRNSRFRHSNSLMTSRALGIGPMLFGYRILTMFVSYRRLCPWPFQAVLELPSGFLRMS